MTVFSVKIDNGKICPVWYANVEEFVCVGGGGSRVIVKVIFRSTRLSTLN